LLYSRLPKVSSCCRLSRPQTGLSGSSWRFRTLATTRSLHQSGQSDLPPVLTLPVPLGMLIPDTLRSDHAPFWYQGVGAVLTDTANLRTPHYHQPIYTSNPRPVLQTAQIVLNATTKLLESGDYLKPSPLHLNQNNNSWQSCRNGRPVAQSFGTETRTGRRYKDNTSTVWLIQVL